MCRLLAVTQHLRGISTPAKIVQQDKRNLALADLRQILPALAPPAESGEPYPRMRLPHPGSPTLLRPLKRSGRSSS